MDQRTSFKSIFLQRKSEKKKFTRADQIETLKRSNDWDEKKKVELLSAAKNYITHIHRVPSICSPFKPFVVKSAINNALCETLLEFKRRRMETRLFEGMEDYFRSNELNGMSVFLQTITLTRAPCIRDVIPIARGALRNRVEQLVLASIGIQGWALSEFDLYCSRSTNISLVVYKAGMMHGMRKHMDCYTLFGAVALIPQDAESGLCVSGLDYKGLYDCGDMIIIDPTTEHHVPGARRETERSALVYSF